MNSSRLSIKKCRCSIKLSPLKQKITSPYLALMLTSRVTFDQLEQVSRGGTMGFINIELLSEIVLPTPPTTEQSAILFFIEQKTKKVDSLIQKFSIVIEQLKEYRTALISEAVTGKIDVRDECN